MTAGKDEVTVNLWKDGGYYILMVFTVVYKQKFEDSR